MGQRECSGQRPVLEKVKIQFSFKASLGAHREMVAFDVMVKGQANSTIARFPRIQVAVRTDCWGPCGSRN